LSFFVFSFSFAFAFAFTFFFLVLGSANCGNKFISRDAVVVVLVESCCETCNVLLRDRVATVLGHPVREAVGADVALSVGIHTVEKAFAVQLELSTLLLNLLSRKDDQAKESGKGLHPRLLEHFLLFDAHAVASISSLTSICWMLRFDCISELSDRDLTVTVLVDFWNDASKLKNLNVVGGKNFVEFLCSD